MTKAMRIHATGEPEVMRYEDITLPPPAAGEARIRHTAISINFSDINVRRGGFYIAQPLQFPVILGNEAAGVVASVGAGVTEVKPGDRVVYAGMSAAFYEKTGSYADERNVPADRLLKIPSGVSDRQAAAMMVKGFTASLVINRVYRPRPGDTILIHAAASGVGLLLVQWAKHLGATVIGTVGTPLKAEVAAAHGCDHTILYREQDFVAAVRAIVSAGVTAVFDGVGKDTFMASLDCVRPFGMLVNYGNASGHVPPVDLLLLAKKGSLSVCRPALSSHIGDVASMRAAAAELFDLVARGVLRIEIGRTYALRDAVAAHRDIEARSFAGSTLLLPEAVVHDATM
jgi:NADPH2:quinone reductase